MPLHLWMSSLVHLSSAYYHSNQFAVMHTRMLVRVCVFDYYFNCPEFQFTFTLFLLASHFLHHILYPYLHSVSISSLLFPLIVLLISCFLYWSMSVFDFRHSTPILIKLLRFACSLDLLAISVLFIFFTIFQIFPHKRSKVSTFLNDEEFSLPFHSSTGIFRKRERLWSLPINKTFFRFCEFNAFFFNVNR